MRSLALMVLLSGCVEVPDVCGDFPGQPCIAVEVRSSSELALDEIRVSGLAGFRTVPNNDAPSPGAPTNFRLPAVLAVVPPVEFRGNFELAVRALRFGLVEARGTAKGEIASSAHVRASVTVAAALAPAPPSIVRLVPPVACVNSAFDLRIEGINLRVVNGVTPRVRVERQTLVSTACPVASGVCSSIDVRVGAIDGATDHPVVVVNPPPDASESESARLELLDRPEIVSTELDGGRCDGFVLSGANFYRVEGTNPTVKIDGRISTGLSTLDCTTTSFDGVQVENCRTIAVLESLPAGNHQVAVVGASPLDCESQTITVPCR